MYREKTDTRFVIEYCLRAVAVVYVPIDDEHPLDSLIECRLCCEGDVIEKAKTHGRLAQGMVPWWPHQAKRSSIFPAQHSCGRITYRPNGKPRHVKRLRSHYRIRVGTTAPRFC
jgi:hypothetical protein